MILEASAGDYGMTYNTKTRESRSYHKSVLKNVQFGLNIQVGTNIRFVDKWEKFHVKNRGSQVAVSDDQV